MSVKDEEFLRRLLGIFRTEAEEHLNAISAALAELRKAATPEAIATALERTARETHSLKGAARAVNLTEIERACQVLETYMTAQKKTGTAPSPETVDTWTAAVDAVAARLARPESDADRQRLSKALEALAATPTPSPSAAPTPGPAPEPAPVVTAVASAPTPPPPPEPPPEPPKAVEPAAPAPVPPSPVAPAPTPAASDSIRISMARLDAILFQSEEMLSAKLSADRQAEELRRLASDLDQWAKEWLILAAGATFPSKSADLASRSREGLKSLRARVAAASADADQDRRALARMLDNLIEDMKSVLMLPFSSLLEAFPRMVRDIARDQGKEVDFVITGGEIEIDKRILAATKDPLVHLVRNAIDHGIEKPGIRAASGKPPRGRVELAVAQVGGDKVEIVVRDDGAGIDLARVKAKAVELHLLSSSEAERLDDAAALNLIFHSGLSTSALITDISGRGLGMAIVREKADALGGTIQVDNRRGQGVTTRIRLPITLSTFRGVLVNLAGRLYVLPTLNVERVVRVRKDEIATVENRETITSAGQAVAFVRLTDVLAIPPAPAAEDRTRVTAVVLVSGGERIAFGVDGVDGEQEVLVKGLGAHLSRVRNVAGATVLGSGEIAPILNVSDLVRSARRASRSAAAPAAIEEKAVKSILIAEDSITSRMLLQGILESAGYRVKTAVDGAEALATLRTEPFDLLVSDVQMPRMDGFELTAKVRQDPKLSNLPVVLVTSLDSREDREKGIDAGANAYIAKSSFDQSNLLEAVRRLI